MTFDAITKQIADYVWGIPLIVMILAVGLILTVCTKFVQIRHFKNSMKFMVKNEEDGKGEVSSFAALCIALSATIGTGNIVGVATAIATGGPGALLWMLVAAFLGMATKYAEGFLAIKYRHFTDDGKPLGGPFYYIEKGMGKKWTWLAKLFAIFGALAGLMGIGTITQVNSISSAVKNLFDPNNKNIAFTIGENSYSWAMVIGGLIVTIATALVVVGGIKKISSVSTVVVPFMAALYALSVFILLGCNIDKIPGALWQIVEGAFNPQAVTGGVVGSIFVAVQSGVARGIFSNESGLGSAPIATASAQSKDAVRQGLVTMTGTFWDTIVVCTLTGLSVIVAGSWKPELDLSGVDITIHSFTSALPFPTVVSTAILTVSLVFFAFTTILGWDFYGEKCLDYLTHGNKVVRYIYRFLYITAILIGPYLTVAAVWNMADIFNGLMAVPNIIALLALSGVIAKETNAYKAPKAERKKK
jgi:AGCS family alanine or glycine:cation symporter